MKTKKEENKDEERRDISRDPVVNKRFHGFMKKNKERNDFKIKAELLRDQ